MSMNLKKEIFSWIKTIIFAIALALIINKFVIVNATVPTGSMETTIMPKDRIIASRLSYLFGEPERGDIAVFKYPDDPTGEILYVKRIIGLPGETIEIKEGNVYIDGILNEEIDKHIKEEYIGNWGPYLIPENNYFMMGDNRNNSLDSRFWENKFVEKNDILGKVIFRYYPGIKMLE